MTSTPTTDLLSLKEKFKDRELKEEKLKILKQIRLFEEINVHPRKRYTLRTM